MYLKNGDSDVWKTLQSGHSCKVECWVQCVWKFVGKVRILQHLNLASFMGAWTEKKKKTSLSGPIKTLKIWRWQFLNCIMSGDETLRQQYEPELKQQLIKCWQSNTPLKSWFKIQSAVGNVILSFQIKKLWSSQVSWNPDKPSILPGSTPIWKPWLCCKFQLDYFTTLCPDLVTFNFHLFGLMKDGQYHSIILLWKKCHFHWFWFLRSISFRILFIIDKNI